jgi:hypothetical protein
VQEIGQFLTVGGIAGERSQARWVKVVPDKGKLEGMTRAESSTEGGRGPIETVHPYVWAMLCLLFGKANGRDAK